MGRTRPEGSSNATATQPLVSVFVLCYNQASYVVETLESVRHQTYRNIQLIITDDASNDGSPDVIRNWMREHRMDCEFIVHSENRGICRTLNEALALARGKYVAMVAADDLWLPEKIERQVEALEHSPGDVGVVYTDAWRADANGTRLPGMFISSHRDFVRMPEGDILDVLLGGNFIPALTPMIRKDCFAQVGRYDERLSFEDWDMWLRIATSFKFVFLPWPSGVYRVVHTSLTHRLFGGPVDRNRLVTFFLMYENCLATGRCTKADHRALVTKLCEKAEEMYRFGITGRRRFLWRALRHNSSARMTLMCILSGLGVPYGAFRQIDKMHSSWIRSAAV